MELPVPSSKLHTCYKNKYVFNNYNYISTSGPVSLPLVSQATGDKGQQGKLEPPSTKTKNGILVDPDEPELTFQPFEQGANMHSSFTNSNMPPVDQFISDYQPGNQEA